MGSGRALDDRRPVRDRVEVARHVSADDGLDAAFFDEILQLCEKSHHVPRAILGYRRVVKHLPAVRRIRNVRQEEQVIRIDEHGDQAVIV